MKVYISSDMEGTAGIVEWAQCRGPGRAYELGCGLLLAEVNAAIDGAVAGGATSVLVNDSHGQMANLPPQELHARASYLSGRYKPGYMMEGLDASYDVVLYVSYHAAMGTAGVLSHTYNPRAVGEVRLDGTVAGESGINALVAAHHGVPVGLVTGDQYVGPEAEPFCPGVVAVAVKRSISRFAAESLHPEVAAELIRAGAERAVAHPPRGQAFGRSVTLEVDWLTAGQAELAAGIPGMLRSAGRTTVCTGSNLELVYRTFVATLQVTRGLVD